MRNRVTWKKGMRLSTEVFNAMERATEKAVDAVGMLGAANRYGLYPSPAPFEISVNVYGNALEVTSLNCHGMTKLGCLVDIEFDSNFANTLDTRISIPACNEGEALYLVAKVHQDSWREINDTYSELCYTFELLPEHSALPDDCLPIGLLVNQYGWRLDETDFVPPCLYVRAHPKYVGQWERATELASSLSQKCSAALNCVAKSLLATVWAGASSAFARLDKERDTLTPGQMLAILQQLAGSFLIGCSFEEYVSLEDPEPFRLFMQKTYDARSLHRDIETGLALCAEIRTKMEGVCSMTEAPRPATKPAPKPAPKPKAPEPEPLHRRGWEGIEI